MGCIMQMKELLKDSYLLHFNCLDFDADLGGSGKGYSHNCYGPLAVTVEFNGAKL